MTNYAQPPRRPRLRPAPNLIKINTKRRDARSLLGMTNPRPLQSGLAAEGRGIFLRLGLVLCAALLLLGTAHVATAHAVDAGRCDGVAMSEETQCLTHPENPTAGDGPACPGDWSCQVAVVWARSDGLAQPAFGGALPGPDSASPGKRTAPLPPPPRGAARH